MDRCALDWDATVTTVLVLLLASSIIGLATGLFFRVWALLLVSPALAVVAAFVLQSWGFGFWTGVPIIVGCLIVNQAAYLAATFRQHRRELSVQDDIDGAPGKRGHRGISDDNE
jgi:hypothetical protein